MERGHRDRSLAAQDGRAVDRGQHLHVVADPLDRRGPDEHGVEGVIEAVDVDVGLETVDLGAVGVAQHPHVERGEHVLVGAAVSDLRRQQDHPGAGAEHGQAGPDPLPDRLEQARAFEEHGHRGRLTAGDHERVDRSQLLGGADLDGRGAQLREDRRVGGEGPLEREDADGGRYQPRSASLVSSVAISRPFMAAPSPVDTFTRMSGSW